MDPKTREILKTLQTLEYPSCYTSPENCKNCYRFGNKCTDEINYIDNLRHDIGEI